MKPVDVNEPVACILTLMKEIMRKNLNLKLSSIQEQQNRKSFAKGYVPNWSEEVFVITKVKNTVLCTYIISDLKSEELVGTFYEKELERTN